MNTQRRDFVAGVLAGVKVRAMDMGDYGRGPNGEKYAVILRDLHNPLSSAWAWFSTWNAAVKFAKTAIKGL
jgi:hypothetical protein